jgi:nucleoside-diphosphate-sugar epimerase
LKNHYAITQFLESARLGKPLEVWGTGETVRSYLHGIDMATWLWKILLEGNGVYDVGSYSPISMFELAMQIADMTEGRVIMTEPDSPTSIYLPKQTRVLELGCRETINLYDAIKRTMNGII